MQTRLHEWVSYTILSCQREGRSQDAVGAGNSRQAVSDDKDGVILHHAVQRLLHHRLAIRIQRTCCLQHFPYFSRHDISITT